MYLFIYCKANIYDLAIKFVHEIRQEKEQKMLKKRKKNLCIVYITENIEHVWHGQSLLHQL